MTDQSKSMVPKVRFKGFTDEWEQRKLSELFKRNNERNKNLEFTPKRTISIATMRFNSEGNGASKKSISNYKVLRIGDAAFEGHTNNHYQFGRFVVNDIGNGIMSPRFATIRPIKVHNIVFWKFYLHSEKVMNRILAKSTKSGTMMNELVYGDLFKRTIIIPKNEEQKKIGNLLQNIENVITLQQRKIDNLNSLKKGLQQKIFSAKRDMRFKQYDGDWIQCKLGDIGNTYTGLSGKTKKDFGHGKAHFITYMNVYANPVTDKNMVDKIEIDGKQNIVKPGDIFFTTSSETPDEVGMSSVLIDDLPNTYLNSFCFAFRPTKETNPYFMSSMLRSSQFRKKMIKLAQGISRFNISKDKVMRLNIELPELDEQKKIGELFNTLSNEIDNEKVKFSKLKQMKKFLLQSMFI